MAKHPFEDTTIGWFLLYFVIKLLAANIASCKTVAPEHFLDLSPIVGRVN